MNDAPLTNLDAGVFPTHHLARLVGEEHVGGKTTLDEVAVWASDLGFLHVVAFSGKRVPFVGCAFPRLCLLRCRRVVA